MAMDFYLSLMTSKTSEEILEMITSLEGFHKTDEFEGFWAEGLVGGVSPIEEGISQESLYEETGVLANTSIWYRLQWGNDDDVYTNGLRDGLRAYVTILQNTDGDAVIQLDGNDIRLRRKNGRITLNPQSFYEDEEAMWRFKDVPFDYEVKEMNLNE